MLVHSVISRFFDNSWAEDFSDGHILIGVMYTVISCLFGEKAKLLLRGALDTGQLDALLPKAERPSTMEHQGVQCTEGAMVLSILPNIHKITVLYPTQIGTLILSHHI